MGNKNLIKRSIFKEKISELKSKKFSFEINKIELPNGHEGEYGIIKHPGAALAVPITKDNKVIILRQYRFCLLYTSPSPRDVGISRMPSSA